MRKFLTLLLFFSLVFGACYGQNSKTSGDPDLSYAVGIALGADLKQFGFELDYGSLLEGLRTSIEDGEARMTMDEAIAKIQTAYAAVVEQRNAEAKAREKEWLSENARKSGVQSTASGLQYEVLTQGKGARPEPASRVKVHYEGRLVDGTVFDSSLERNEPVVFGLTEVIPGWTEGMQLMNVGSKYRLYIPSALAYGDQGVEDIIPPGSTLVFDVELLSIEK